MASEKCSSVGSVERSVQTNYVLDERRRAALAEVDNDNFSYVPSTPKKSLVSYFFSGGSMSRSAALLVSASSPMRK